jgi:multidrug resistance efflux pump
MPSHKPHPGLARNTGWKLIGIIVLLLLAGWLLLRPREKNAAGVTFAAKRGALQIKVVENGSIEAREAQEVRSEVKGWQGTKVLSIVEEGYQVTEDDVRTNKVLVELDSSEIRKNITTSEIDFQAKQAALTEAQQAYEIQLAQNTGDVKSAEQKARFARLDMEKYLGDVVAGEIAKQLGLDEKLAKLTSANGLEPEMEAAASRLPPAVTPGSAGSPAPTGAVIVASVASAGGVQMDEAKAAAGAVASTDAPLTIQLATPPPPAPSPAPPAQPPPPVAEPAEPARPVVIDYSKYADVELLGDGEARQKLRENKDTLLLAEKERSASKVKLDGTERLFQKEFVTRTDVDTARLEYEQVDLKVKKATTALNLFIKYEFPKQAEEFVSKFEEAVRVLERTRKEAVSKLAQARAKLKSSEQQYRIVQEQRKDLEDQLAKCTIRAKKTGLLIYGGTGQDRFWYGEERIREGAVIRERQPIITIPDMTRMGVSVKIHEAHIKKVKKGMKARIRVDAQPDKPLTGEVIKVGVLPDSQNRWMNPDLKVYLTTIAIEGTHDWLKPGMSAKVEVEITELKDVVYVPIQAIAPTTTGHVCHVVSAGKVERRAVETGEYSDEFIEIKSGVKEGETVLLRAPEAAGQAEESKGGEKASKPDKAGPKAPAKPAPAPATAGRETPA